MNFEASLKRLEEITTALEKGGLQLEDSLKLFAEGTSLISQCEKYLDSAELKIKKLFEGDSDEQ